MSVSIIIPFYNEEECFQSTIDSLTSVLDGAGLDYELVLVNNGSRDRTGELIEKAIAQNEHLKNVTVEINEGYGWGIISGLQKASGDYIGFMAGDGQIYPEDVLKTIQHIMNSDCDMVKVDRIQRNDGWLRVFVSKLYNMMVPVLFGMRTRDLNGTPKIFKRNHFPQFELYSKDWFIDAELMVKSEWLNLKIEEVPIIFQERKGGSSHVSILKAIWEFVVNVYRFKTGKHFKEWKKSRQ